MSEVTDVTAEAAEAPEAPQPHEPHIQVLKGEPTVEELGALIAVLGTIGGGTAPPPPEPARWGLPVDKLRYPVYSWQRITLQEMVHMRR
ncbi:acyl-CoA carboxylase subunit epsilon [Mycobacterium asiaticum]|uniref:Acyl-CoA carboxylase subunit epsilon n=1 Tax=Mycobacterium asiaticum TaxID=1790 RepID=A0A1A3N7K3_MYCAS|nr:hypothetical protein A5635_05290 [Mycobacterium asiaticum]